MRLEVFLLIMGMALVTYIPRMLPAVFLHKLKFGPRFEKFLKLIPYTAMSALVFPGIFTVDPANWYIGVVGGVAAVLLAWNKLPLALTVLGSVLAVFLTYLIV